MATFGFNGKDVRVIQLHELTLGDLAFIREHYEIAGQLELEDGLSGMEPIAWRALMVASVRRETPDVDPKTPEIDAVPLVPLLEAMNADADARREEEAKAAAKKGRGRPTSGSRSSRASSGQSSSA